MMVSERRAIETERQCLPAGSKLRVGQILGSFGGGGAQRLAYNLAVGLGSYIDQSFAIAVRSAGHYAEVPPVELTLKELNAQRGGVIGALAAVLRLRRIITGERLDVLHVHGTGSLPFVVLAALGMRHRVKVVFTWQDSERVLKETGWRRTRMIWAIRRCASVSGSCRKVADQLKTGAGLRDTGIFHGGVPVVSMRAKHTDRPPGVLWLGRVVPAKDPQALIRAAGELRRAGIEFSVTVVGKPIASTEWYFKESQQLVGSLGLNQVVRMPGFVPDSDMEELYACSQIGVQTSHTEGLSIALMEQMMAGLAIVATDVGDTNCAIEHERNGLLIPPKDDEALVAALRRLIVDPELRQRLGQAARETAIRKFSLEAMTERALQEYVRVTQR